MNDARLTEKLIFEAAFDFSSPGERAAYLERVCGHDVQMRKEIEDLLAAHARLDEFHPPASAVDSQSTANDPTAEGPGAVIGPYKLMEQIGEGGMGLVFVAEQQRPIRRKVALKVIKPGMDTRQVIGRFEAERQVLALMNHPNIARIFDGGETAGRNFDLPRVSSHRVA